MAQGNRDLAKREKGLKWIVADWYRREFWGGPRIGFTQDRERAKRFRSTRSVMRSLGQIRRRYGRRTVDYYRADAPLPGERQAAAEAGATGGVTAPGGWNGDHVPVPPQADATAAPEDPEQELLDLATVPEAALRSELERRRHDLEHRRDRLQEELASIDHEVAELEPILERHTPALQTSAGPRTSEMTNDPWRK